MTESKFDCIVLLLRDLITINNLLRRKRKAKVLEQCYDLIGASFGLEQFFFRSIFLQHPNKLEKKEPCSSGGTCANIF